MLLEGLFYITGIYTLLMSRSAVSELLTEHLNLSGVTDHHGSTLCPLLAGNPSMVGAQSESPSHTPPGQACRDGACALLKTC